ncbi:hypothetical protein KP79_PYT00012 [Mizuhopecten yessoensis]|uniref:Uncharacterized protein n=1 Tax=Mizuhopecten yessoensis TaxID=6573 RepID=A0A210R6W2_MIZYE|nr:hypothetical protein KP79_PYT00012 [Mizuhopecten yessoensis]
MCSPSSRAQRRRGLAYIFEGIDQTVVERLVTTDNTSDEEEDDSSSFPSYQTTTYRLTDDAMSNESSSRNYRRSVSYMVLCEHQNDSKTSKRRNGMHNVFENVSLPERAQLQGIHCMNVTSHLQLAGY